MEMTSRDDRSTYQPLLVEEDSSDDDAALLNEVNRTLGDGAPSEANGHDPHSLFVRARKFKPKKKVPVSHVYSIC